MFNLSHSPAEKKLLQALLTLKTEAEVKDFLVDLLTPAELEEFVKRFQMATLLWTTKKSYLEIAQEVDTSTTTVTRVARFLFKEPFQGYMTALKRLYPKIKPAR
ncbi:MAG TPA: YerC/YecD family TrpR-related protein [Vitreimonas sp.]|nr:YerC/YecD family TrpR-related protein [Vitreimonas sp.]